MARTSIAMEDKLIYDIGMHNGNDTAFYLACGFRVIAVEADPDLVAAANNRFKAEIESQNLIILNVGIAEEATTAEFWINEVHSQFNSFDLKSVARFGHPHHSTLVPCRRLDEIFSEYGVPYYLKIDIEGNDIVCCHQIASNNKPRYISVEISRIELPLKLRDLGYDRFKLVTQLDLQPVEMRETKPHLKILRSIYRAANYCKDDRRFSLRVARASASKVLQLAGVLGLGPWGVSMLKSRRLPEWKFIEGCSGTFGEDVPGNWLTWKEIVYLWLRELNEYERMGRVFWCDLHATTSSEK